MKSGKKVLFSRFYSEKYRKVGNSGKLSCAEKHIFYFINKENRLL